MQLYSVVLALLATAAIAPAAVNENVELTSALKDVKLQSGDTLRVEAGELQVLESRRRTTIRRVTIPYYRLRSSSSTPASPIFLLAGGPGGSWIDQFKSEENYREVAFYQSIADVVLFDQRGGGHAQPTMACPDTAALPAGAPFDPAAVHSAMRAAATACRDRWLKEGVDLRAYNTDENSADVNELRLALGYGKVTLIGGSYGSHLALHFMRRYPAAVDRVVLYGVEGPDHTWDHPSAMLATLERIAAATEQSAAFSGRVPEGGLLKTLEQVLSRLESTPQHVTVQHGTESRTVVVNAALVRQMARRGAGRRSEPNAWPEMILALYRGDYSLVARAALNNTEVRVAPPVHHSMDCSSAISDARRQRYAHDTARSLLGDINLEYDAICAVWPSEDLGAPFRANVTSDIPTVIFHGTWDMSTPIENAREVAASLRHGQLVEVIGGNHGALYNAYERWQPMYSLMREFLAGRNVRFPVSVDDMADIVFKTTGTR